LFKILRQVEKDYFIWMTTKFLESYFNKEVWLRIKNLIKRISFYLFMKEEEYLVEILDKNKFWLENIFFI
jgi:hypothetical protein